MTLPPVYVELRDRIRIHLHQIRKIEKKHPEYTVALLIALASEALSRLRSKSGSTVFARDLLGKHGLSEAVGRGLFKAVRHGLAHRYDTGFIAVGKQKVAVVITWKRPDLHLTIRRLDWLRDGVKRPGVYLDMETMCKDLNAYLRKMDKSLVTQRKLARSVIAQGRRLDEKYMVQLRSVEELRAWEQFLERRP
jgi:hypothetical protein